MAARRSKASRSMHSSIAAFEASRLSRLVNFPYAGIAGVLRRKHERGVAPRHQLHRFQTGIACRYPLIISLRYSMTLWSGPAPSPAIVGLGPSTIILDRFRPVPRNSDHSSAFIVLQNTSSAGHAAKVFVYVCCRGIPCMVVISSAYCR